MIDIWVILVALQKVFDGARFYAYAPSGEIIVFEGYGVKWGWREAKTIIGFSRLELLNVTRKQKGSDGTFTLTEGVATILKRLKLYDHDRAWRWAKHKED